MPIRFRCAYCNQLMGIATRKAGKVVRCPKCAGEIIVPSPEGDEAPDATEPSKPNHQVFDSPDFDKHLQGSAQTADAAVDLLPAPDPGELHELAAPPQRGVFLTPTMATVLAVGLLIVLGIIFLIGFFVGRATAPVSIVIS